MIPIIIETNPLNSSVDVAVDSLITIEFGTELLTATIIGTNFLLENLNSQTNVACIVSLNNTVNQDDGTIVTITPQDDIQWNGAGLNGLTDYRLAISGVQSADGGSMIGSYTLSFSTVEDSQSNTENANGNDYVEHSYDIYGRGEQGYVYKTDSRRKLEIDNQEYLNYLLTEHNSSIINWESPSYPARQFIKHKIEYDLVYQSYIKLATSAQTKKLADLSISYRGKLDNLKDLLARLKKQYKKWENELLGVTDNHGVATFRKGSEIDPTFDWQSRSIKNRNEEEV